MTFTPEQIKALEAPLDPRHVVKPTGQFGAKGDYIEGWHAIAEANRIFGFGGWSYTIAMTQDSLREGVDSRQNPQWQAAYTCICTVTVGDVTRQDVGFGSGFAKQVGDAIEGATKEAATDALKRALRSFGNAFGLALYDKSRANVQAAPPPMISEATLAAIKQAIGPSGVSVQAVVETYNVSALDELTAEQGERALRSLQKRISDNSKRSAA